MDLNNGIDAPVRGAGDRTAKHGAQALRGSAGCAIGIA